MAHLLGGTASAHWAGLIGALIQVALIDITLASDNAVAVGMAASGLPRPQRHYAIVLGLGGAVVLLCVLAFFAVKLLEAGGGGLILGGGVLLLLVSWQMWRDLRAARNVRAEEERTAKKPKTLMRALSLIFIADISTSLDNVLAIAGVARGQPAWVLMVGLALSVALTGFAAVGVARLMHRWPWLGYIGLAVVLFVAGGMLWDGAHQMGLVKI
jgi:YjbE family integral membrane protein